MAPSLHIASDRWLGRLALGWHYGALPARLTLGATILSLFVLTAASWQSVRAHRQSELLSAHRATLQSARAASAAAIQAAEPPDVIQALPSAPGVAQVMQTLQQAADKEGAQVTSLLVEDHAPTASALGHIDLILSIKAPYPSILVLIQQVLDRYPGATLRQIQIAHRVSPMPSGAVPTAPMMGASEPQAMSMSDAQATLAFWRRPLNVAPAPLSGQTPQTSGGAASATTASAIVPSGAAVRTASATLTLMAGATPIQSFARASAVPK